MRDRERTEWGAGRDRDGERPTEMKTHLEEASGRRGEKQVFQGNEISGD